MKTKKFLSMILSIALLGSVSVPVFAETIENSAAVSSDSDVKSNYEYSKDGKLILSSYDLVKVIKGEDQFIATAMLPWSNQQVIEFEESPKNIRELVESGCRFGLIKGEKTCLEQYYCSDAVESSVKVVKGPDNYSGEIKVVFDMNKKEIRDYKTDTVIQNLKGSDEYIDKYYYVNTDYICREVFYDGYSFYRHNSQNSVKYEDLVAVDNYIAYETGDINCDEKIDMTDLSELSLIVLGDSTLSEDQTTAADIDGDGDLTVADLSRLKQYVSNQISSLR